MHIINKLASDSCTKDRLLKKLFNIVKKNNTINKKLILPVTDIKSRLLDSVNASNVILNFGFSFGKNGTDRLPFAQNFRIIAPR